MWYVAMNRDVVWDLGFLLASASALYSSFCVVVNVKFFLKGKLNPFGYLIVFFFPVNYETSVKKKHVYKLIYSLNIR